MEASIATKLYPHQTVSAREAAYNEQLVAPTAHVQAVQQAVAQTVLEATALANGASSVSSQTSSQQRQLELVFVHDCRNHGCNRLQCVLCKHNPNKRCTGNFAHKYWVGDKLLAKCEGEIQIELVDAMTGEQVTEDLSNIRLELCILDGNKFNSRCREMGEQMEILDECEVLKNQKGEPLMIAGGTASSTETPQVALKFRPGEASVSLKEVKVTESSESVLAGTKRPPFRMVVRATDANGSRMDIRPAVSEEFVVVTKRTKNLKKQEIPSLDDPISKLNHIGKETVKKLNEIKASADEMNLDLKLPRELWRVTKVREFQRVAKLCEADGHMQQKLKQLLKLSKEKWDAACEHAKTAVQVDNRMRAWYMKNMSVGLLYNCSLGDLRPDAPVALLQNRRHEGVDFMEVVPMEHQLPAQRDQVQASCEQAMRLWWEDFHPGWMIFTLGNRHFETLNQIIQYSQSTMLKGSLIPGDPNNIQDNGFSNPEAHAYRGETSGAAPDHASFGQRKTQVMSSLSFGGHTPWPAEGPGGGPGGGPHHMSAQEESAALLKELYAQQLANSQGAEGRAGAAQPSGLGGQYEASRGGMKGEGGPLRPTAPNPFEGFTATPFQSSTDTGRREGSDAGDGHSSHGHQSNPSWMQHLGALGSVNSDVVNNPNASMLSLSNFMKNNSLGSLTSTIADLSNIPSVSGPGRDFAHLGTDHKAPHMGNSTWGQGNSPSKPAGGSRNLEWAASRDPSSHPPGHSPKGTSQSEAMARGSGGDSDGYVQGTFLQQLQQRRQQQKEQRQQHEQQTRGVLSQYEQLARETRAQMKYHLHESGQSHPDTAWPDQAAGRAVPRSPQDSSGAFSNSPEADVSALPGEARQQSSAEEQSGVKQKRKRDEATDVEADGALQKRPAAGRAVPSDPEAEGHAEHAVPGRQRNTPSGKRQASSREQQGANRQRERFDDMHLTSNRSDESGQQGRDPQDSKVMQDADHDDRHGQDNIDDQTSAASTEGLGQEGEGREDLVDIMGNQ